MAFLIAFAHLGTHTHSLSPLLSYIHSHTHIYSLMCSYTPTWIFYLLVFTQIGQYETYCSVLCFLSLGAPEV